MKKDYTSGSLGKNIFLLGLPMTIEMVLLSVYSLVDMYFVSFLGEKAIAAVALSGAILFIPISFSVGLGNAYHMLISRRIGEKNFPSAWIILGQVFWLSTLSGIFLGILGYFSVTSSLNILGASPNVIRHGKVYLEQRHIWLFIANLLFCFNACLRGSGNAKTALFVLGISNISNIFLDPVLIFGFWKIPAYGVKGAAYATIISQALGLFMQILIFSRGTDRLKFTWSSITPNFQTIKKNRTKSFFYNSSCLFAAF